MKRLNPPQFELLAQLAGMNPKRASYEAAFRYLVLGYSTKESADLSGISRQAVEAALYRLAGVERLARDFVRITPAETAAASQAPNASPQAPGSPS